MKPKNMLIVSFILLIALMMGSVCAADNNATDDIINVENTQDSDEIAIDQSNDGNVIEKKADSNDVLSNDDEAKDLSTPSNCEITAEPTTVTPISSNSHNSLLKDYYDDGDSYYYDEDGNDEWGDELDDEGDDDWDDDSEDYWYDEPEKMDVIIKAPAKKVKYKSNSYFKATLSNYFDSSDPLKRTKVQVKIWTGKKVKKYNLKTNSKGIIKINTKKLSVGSHKVKIILKEGKHNYAATKTSKIIVKKTSAKKSKYKVLTVKAKKYFITKKWGKFKVQTKIWDMYSYSWGYYKYIDVFLYKNGNLVPNTKYLTKYKIHGKWTGWKKLVIGTSHHRYATYNDVNSAKIQIKFKK